LISALSFGRDRRLPGIQITRRWLKERVTNMRLKSFALSWGTVLLLASSARAQNYTITLHDGQSGTGNVIMTYFGPMLSPVQNWTPVTGFVLNPGKMQWTTPPIPADVQPGSLNPCSAAIGNGGPDGEASITCASAAPGTTNGVPLFSFCFQGAKWPIPVGTYNVDSANQQPNCGNYFYAYSQLQGYSSYDFVNSGSIVVAPAMPEVLYDSNSGNTVAAYSVSQADGGLAPLAGSPFPNGGGQTNYFALHPSKKFLYVADYNALTISTFSIDGAGSLSSSAAPVPLNPAPPSGGFFVAIDPLGRYLYAATVWGWPSNVYAWKIDQATGALSPIAAGMPATAGSFSDSHAFCVTVDPKGRFVFVCNQDDGNVTSFIIDQQTGALSNARLTQTGLRPRGISVEPNGLFAYVANYGVNPGICQGTYAHGTGAGCVVRAFTIDQSTGALTSIGPNDAVPTGTNPTWITIDPLGRTLYTTNITSNDVSAFSLDPNTGALSPVGTYPAGQGPYFVDVTPSGKSAHVANVFDGTTYSYSRDSSGVLTFTGSTPGSSPNGLVSIQPEGDSDWGLAQVNSGNTFTGNQTVNGTLSATAFVGNGSGLTGVVAQTANTANYASTAGTTSSATFATNAAALGGVAAGSFARLDLGNSFNGNQSVNGNVNAAGSISATSATLNGPFSSGLTAALNASGILIPSTGGATSTLGFSSYPLQFWASSFSSNSVPNPRFNQIFQLIAEPTGNNSPNPSATLNLQFISTDFPPPPSGFAMQETGFSITGQGGVTIGGGTNITRHLSVLSQAVTFNIKMTPGTCTVWSTSIQAASDGDTVAVSLGSSLMSGNVVFSAWANNGSVSVRICNPTSAPTTLGTGNIRVDLWKH
jgi:6-phosphogluconolactonase (cycloisomerase 2 family)